MLTESDKAKLQKLDEFIPEYIRRRIKIDNAVDWSEEYKWKILSALNEKKLFENITLENINDIARKLRSEIPSQGSFAYWMDFNKFAKITEIDQKKASEMLFNLLYGNIEIQNRMKTFLSNAREINPKDSMGTSTIAYILAAYDCKQYPIFKDEIFQTLKEKTETTDWSSDISEKYQKYQEICLYFGEKLKPLLTDRIIRGVNVTSEFTALDGQDFLFIVNEILKPRRYWKIAPGDNAFLWKDSLKDKNIRIGWDNDVSKFSSFEEFRDFYTNGIDRASGNDTQKAKEQWDFGHMQVGDIVIANKGKSFILGIGKVTGPIKRIDKYKKYKQAVPVDWIDLQTRKIPKGESVSSCWPMKTLRLLSVEDYNHLIDVCEITTEDPRISDIDETEGEKVNNNNRINLWIERKNIILYGPPGTSKTFATKNFCVELFQKFNNYNLSPTEVNELIQKRVEFITFHPSYQYEHFIEGLTINTPEVGKPYTEVSYILKPGIFKEICKKALGSLNGLSVEEITTLSWKEIFKRYEDNEQLEGINVDDAQPYIMIIDEINRGDISKIFGELITLLEPSKRIGETNCLTVSLPLSGDKFAVPPNLFIIATMNTADRSIALLDVALRRRFSFISMMPEYGLIYSEMTENKEKLEVDLEELIEKSIHALREINSRICQKRSLGRDKQIGHTYLMNIQTIQQLYNTWKYSIYPLLEEYCYNNFEQISAILFDQDEKETYLNKDFGLIDDFNLAQFLDDITKQQ